ncbi:hypothetical protein [Niallia sp. Krafla_26]|uniref:hypothetical protein n=1 Tax=Niallia sp. Krafla_26 TaxID=3064703 RepID=UPI003D18454F
MDKQYLKQCVNKIKVTNLPYADVEVENHSPLKMIGKGRQGAVFKVNDDICVKVFGNEEDCEREYYALSLGKHTDLFPMVHDKGPLHIAMDFIKGVDLREYLQSQPLTEELSFKLIQLLITFKEIGYERIDHHKRQIFILPNGHLKVIDVARTVWRDRVYPYPRKLINSLGEEYKKTFLSHVQKLSADLYAEWSHYIEMEKLSRHITKKLLTQSSDKNSLLIESLLNSKVEKEYRKRLEDLVYKVFKDEWVKVMLAKGVNPDVIMDKIEEKMEKLQVDNGKAKGKDEDHYIGFYKNSQSKYETAEYGGAQKRKNQPRPRGRSFIIR